jgi:hypothetical protein
MYKIEIALPKKIAVDYCPWKFRKASSNKNSLEIPLKKSTEFYTVILH